MLERAREEIDGYFSIYWVEKWANVYWRWGDVCTIPMVLPVLVTVVNLGDAMWLYDTRPQLR